MPRFASLVTTILCFILSTAAYAQLNPLAAKATEKSASTTSATKSGSAGEKPHVLQPLKWGARNEFSLQLGGDTQIRFEQRDNYDMDRKIGDNDKLGFVRTRLNAELTYDSSWKTFVEILDGREIDSRVDELQEDHFDLHQAFLEYSQPKVSPWGVRLGRQELNFGRDKRLVGASNWSNLRRHFDGVDVLYRSTDVDADLFLMKPDYYEHRRGLETVSGHAHQRNHEWFYGGYATLKQFSPHTIEAYFLGLSDLDHERTFPRPVKSEDGTFGTTDRYTVGMAMYGDLWKKKDVGTLKYDTEGAFQFGHRSNDEIKAFMLHGDVAYQWDKPWKPTLGLVGNIATGDKENGDGQANTFSPLFGNSHPQYGIIDFTRLQNLRELALTGSVEPTDKLKGQVELHSFWLDSKTDSWVDSRGTSLGRDQDGRSGRHIGNEIDAFTTYKFNKFVTFEAGAAHFFDGRFARENGRASGANLLYVQTQISF